MLSAASAEPPAPMAVALRPGWLEVRFAREHAVQSWAIVNGGLARTRVVAWHEVRDDELAAGVDPAALLAARMAVSGLEGAVGLMTSRSLSRFVRADAAGGGLTAEVVATIGLGNALRAGDPPLCDAPRAGTINVLCRTSEPLSPGAALEAMALVAEARTLALVEARVPSRRSALVATGTGTDCIAVAWPTAEEPAVAYAGKHTMMGHLIGAAVLEAVRRGVAEWMEERG